MKIRRKGKALAIMLAMILSIAPCIPSGLIVQAATPPGTITAEIEADNGTISLNGGADEAQMSYAQQQAHAYRWYNLKVVLEDLDPSKTNTFKLEVPRGMTLGNIDTYLEQDAQFASTVASSSREEGGNLGGYTFPSGSYTFTLKPGVVATTANIPITFDRSIQTNTITNAVQITISDGSNTTSESLETVKRPVASGLTLPGHPHSGSYFIFTDGTVTTLDSLCRQIILQNTGNPYNMFVTNGSFHLRLNDVNSSTGVRAKIINTGSSSWTMTSNEATGDYYFTYTPSAGYTYTASMNIPFRIEFEENPSEPWVEDDPVTLTYVGSGTYYDYLQFDVDDPLGNSGSSVSSAVARRHLGNVTHNFRYQTPDEKVFVGYGSTTDYLDNIADGQARSYSFESNIDCADADPIINDQTGTLGYFTMGNSGVAESTEKTVEMLFDDTVYGVMALILPYPANQTLTKVEYTTTLNPTWQMANTSITANSRGMLSLNYLHLGIASRSEFITGIRYEFGKVPSGAFYTTRQTASAPDLCFYGKWLAPNDDVTEGQASIRVYDTDTSGNTTDTGSSVVTTKRVDTLAVGFPSPSQAVVSAGETMQFTAPIAAANNSARINASTEYPIFYIRSEVKDENGNLLPVTNIALTNGGRLSGEIDSSKLLITSWEADEDGNGDNDVIIYRIDTANLPASQVCLVYAYVQPNGVVSNNELELYYEIPTTVLTPQQTYTSRDMVYVFDKVATAVTGSSATRWIQSGDIYEGLRNGEDWTKGILTAAGSGNNNVYRVNSIQSILVTSKIKHLTATDWMNYIAGTDIPIPVGTATDSGFQLKIDVINNAGLAVSGTEVYVPIPKEGEDWGTLTDGIPELSLELKQAATVDPMAGTGSIGSYSVKYGLGVTPSDGGVVLQGYTWVDATSVSDWSQVNCIQIIANAIDNQANLEVILDVKADSTTTQEGLTNIWRSTYFQDLINVEGGIFKGFYTGTDFGVQSALSGVKGRLFKDLDGDGIYDGTAENVAGTGWKVNVYDKNDISVALQEKNVNADGTYAFYDLLSDENYIIEVINPDASANMFARTATRVVDNGTGAYGPWGANTFVSTDSDATARAEASAILTVIGTPPNDIVDSATYNIGIMDKEDTVLTWQSADISKGNVAGTTKTLNDYPSVQLPAGVAPAVTATPGYTFTGWVRVTAGGVVPSWNSTPWKAADVIENRDFGDGAGVYGFDSYDYYAVFTESTNTAYKVEHYQQDLGTGTYSIVDEDTEDKTGITGGTGIFAPNSYEGFTYDENQTLPVDKTIAADGTLVIRLYYTRNSYKVEYSYTGYEPTDATDLTPINADPIHTSVEYGATVSIVGAASAVGYDFSGWGTTDAAISGGTFTMPAGNVSITGSFTGAEVLYTVKHYKQDLGATTYSLESTDIETGITGAAGVFMPNSYTGFTYDSGQTTPSSPIIAADGSLEIELYYTRDSYMVEYSYVGYVPADATDLAPINASPIYADVEYGATVPIAGTASATGYDFSGWTTVDATIANGEFTMPAQAVAITGGFTASGSTPYQIVHHIQKLGESTYEVKEIENKTGETDTEVTFASMTYEGFTYDAIQDGWSYGVAAPVIAGDGSLVIDLYYIRNVYEVHYEYDGYVPADASALPNVSSVEYEAEVAVAVDGMATGYTFAGWETTDVTVANEKFTMPSQGVVLSGSFYANTDTTYKVEHYLKDLGATTYTLSDTDYETGTTAEVAAYTDKVYEGFTYLPSETEWDGAESNPIIIADGSQVIRLYYTRNTHIVSYVYTGVIPKGASALPSNFMAEYGEVVRVEPEASATGYTFSGWRTTDEVVVNGAFTMQNKAVEFAGSFTANDDKPGDDTSNNNDANNNGTNNNGTNNGGTNNNVTNSYGSSNNQTTTSKVVSAKTGDSTQVMFWFVLALLAIGTASVVVVKKKRQISK